MKISSMLKESDLSHGIIQLKSLITKDQEIEISKNLNSLPTLFHSNSQVSIKLMELATMEKSKSIIDMEIKKMVTLTKLSFLFYLKLIIVGKSQLKELS